MWLIAMKCPPFEDKIKYEGEQGHYNRSTTNKHNCCDWMNMSFNRWCGACLVMISLPFIGITRLNAYKYPFRCTTKSHWESLIVSLIYRVKSPLLISLRDNEVACCCMNRTYLQVELPLKCACLNLSHLNLTFCVCVNNHIKIYFMLSCILNLKQLKF